MVFFVVAAVVLFHTIGSRDRVGNGTKAFDAQRLSAGSGSRGRVSGYSVVTGRLVERRVGVVVDDADVSDCRCRCRRRGWFGDT